MQVFFNKYTLCCCSQNSCKLDLKVLFVKKRQEELNWKMIVNRQTLSRNFRKTLKKLWFTQQQILIQSPNPVKFFNQSHCTIQVIFKTFEATNVSSADDSKQTNKRSWIFQSRCKRCQSSFHGLLKSSVVCVKELK